MEKIELFVSLVRDEVKDSSPVNWTPAVDILADALIWLSLSEVRSHRTVCGTYLVRRSEVLKKRLCKIYGEHQLREFVVWCVDADCLYRHGGGKNFVAMARQIITLRAGATAISKVLALHTEDIPDSYADEVYAVEDEREDT